MIKENILVFFIHLFQSDKCISAVQLDELFIDLFLCRSRIIQQLLCFFKLLLKDIKTCYALRFIIHGIFI